MLVKRTYFHDLHTPIQFIPTAARNPVYLPLRYASAISAKWKELRKKKKKKKTLWQLHTTLPKLGHYQIVVVSLNRPLQ